MQIVAGDSIKIVENIWEWPLRKVGNLRDVMKGGIKWSM
jgi:hypothetical protein